MNFSFSYLTIIVFCLCIFSPMAAINAQQVKTKSIYKDPSRSVDERVNDLLKRMTLEEKVGQLSTLLGWHMYHKVNDHTVEVSQEFKDAVQDRNIGSLWGTLRADPWTKKTLDNGLNPLLAARLTNELQRYVIENSRLGIPVFLAEECMHGHMAIGTTVFPSAIGQGSTWNPDLLYEMASAIALETRVQGAHIGYGPILDLAREPRWSRVEETFGEDPYLNAQLGIAVVKGFQGEDISSGENVISTLKHFAAYGVSEGGHNGAAVIIGERDLQNYLYPFEKAVKAGALSVMTAYSSIDGIPSTAHDRLLDQTLKEKWGFDGFVVSDLGSIEGLRGSHQVAGSPQDAAAMAINAGVDADLGGNGFDAALIEAVKNNQVSVSVLDAAVSRVLALKFRMGLFENPFVDTLNIKENVRNERHKALARKVAQQSLVLLKNEGNILPLNKNVKKVAVIGPNAHNIYNQLGDYTAPQPEDNIVTVFEGIKNKLPGAQVTYVKGTAIRDTTQTDIEAAVEAAKKSDVAIVVLGGSSARDFKTKYIETGAAVVEDDKGIISDMESGEGYDRATLQLMGKQLELLKAVKSTGTPTVLVTIKGRPLLLNWPAENIPAILEAWYPGQEGGNAIADVLFGDYNPSGKLPVSVPKSVGQLPVYYNHLVPQHQDYVEIDAQPLYPFGHGLSYAGFEYSALKVNVQEKKLQTIVDVQLQVKNTGAVTGEEVVQLYLNDVVSSVVTPSRQLKDFKKISIAPGESKTVKLRLLVDDLALLNVQNERTVEAGTFEIMIGSSSQDIRLKEDFEITKSIELKN